MSDHAWGVGIATLDSNGATLDVRFRTVGDATCTAAIESSATTIEQVIAETSVARITERGATRADDRISEAGMEDRKKLGYF